LDYSFEVALHCELLFCVKQGEKLQDGINKNSDKFCGHSIVGFIILWTGIVLDGVTVAVTMIIKDNQSDSGESSNSASFSMLRQGKGCLVAIVTKLLS